jgi:4-hydroxybenzoate polyprenyltransferase
MQRLKTILRLLRFPNLVIIALVLYLQRFCIVIPELSLEGISLSWTSYNLVVLGTMLIAAGGYLINDYFDEGIDTINNPGKAILLRFVSPRTLLIAYALVTIAGLISIAVACTVSGVYLLWYVYLFAAVVLFWYSYSLKKVLILGNLAVAMASAFTMPTAWLFDRLVLSGGHEIFQELNVVFYDISVRVAIFTLFAFLTSFGREIIKDIEDMEGDSQFGCHSIPVVFGIKAAKNIIAGCFALILLLLFSWQYELLLNRQPGISLYLAIAVDLPLLWLTSFVFRMNGKVEIHRAGLVTKLIMVTGILSMLLFLI